MLFIHHHKDSEREEKPPPHIRCVASRWCEVGGPALDANTRGFVRATKPRVDLVMATPATCGSNYWEIVIERDDL